MKWAGLKGADWSQSSHFGGNSNLKNVFFPNLKLFSIFFEVKFKISNYELFFNFKLNIFSDKQYRSFSTGDLVSPSQPSAFEPDFMEMEFGATPTTSSLPSHFDDNDLVPVEFKKSGVKLIPQGTRKAEKAKKFGSFEELSKVKLEDIHRAQSWFFVDVDPKSAERILMSNGFSDSSFLISFFRQKYVLSIWRKTKVEHLVIRNYQKKNGTMAFQLDIDRSFK